MKLVGKVNPPDVKVTPPVICRIIPQAPGELNNPSSWISCGNLILLLFFMGFTNAFSWDYRLAFDVGRIYGHAGTGFSPDFAVSSVFIRHRYRVRDAIVVD
jgi:hypothetical protein